MPRELMHTPTFFICSFGGTVYVYFVPWISLCIFWYSVSISDPTELWRALWLKLEWRNRISPIHPPHYSSACPLHMHIHTHWHTNTYTQSLLSSKENPWEDHLSDKNSWYNSGSHHSPMRQVYSRAKIAVWLKLPVAHKAILHKHSAARQPIFPWISLSS